MSILGAVRNAPATAVALRAIASLLDAGAHEDAHELMERLVQGELFDDDDPQEDDDDGE